MQLLEVPQEELPEVSLEELVSLEVLDSREVPLEDLELLVHVQVSMKSTEVIVHVYLNRTVPYD